MIQFSCLVELSALVPSCLCGKKNLITYISTAKLCYLNAAFLHCRNYRKYFKFFFNVNRMH